jgi:flagellin
MNILNGTDAILLNLGVHQRSLQTLTQQLSSGLRINSAVDDPSGLAIADNLQTRSQGLQQSVENVQNGTNLLTVADGAASSIQNILQRIDSLIVEAHSDINSNTQLQSIQTEIEQMLHEVNTIAGNANFNGVKLFDGSHDTYVAPTTANVSFVEVNPGYLPSGSQPTGDSVSNSQLPTAKLIQQDPNFTIEDSAVPYVTGLMIFEVTSSGTNLVDPQTGLQPGPDVVLHQIIYSPDQSFANGVGNETILDNVLQSNIGANAGSGGVGTPISEQTPGGTQSITFDLANIQQSDVGTAMAVEIVAPQQSGGGTAININDGGQEGTTVGISLPTLSTSALQISGISVLPPTMVDDQNSPGAPTGVDSSNQYAAMDAQFRVEQAIQQISSARAQIGAQMVSTQTDATNDSTTATNLTAAESNIRDLNVGSAVTQFTQQQIMNQVGTSVLSQYSVDTKQLTGLLIQALIA